MFLYSKVVGKDRHSFSKDNCFDKESGISVDLWQLS